MSVYSVDWLAHIRGIGSWNAHGDHHAACKKKSHHYQQFYYFDKKGATLGVEWKVGWESETERERKRDVRNLPGGPKIKITIKYLFLFFHGSVAMSKLSLQLQCGGSVGLLLQTRPEYGATYH